MLEKHGHACHYDKCDVNGCIPAAPDSTNPDRKTTEVDIHAVEQRMNQAFEKGIVKLRTSVSENAGR